VVQLKEDEFGVILFAANDGTGELRKTSLVDGNGEKYNLKSLVDSIKKIMEERKDELKKLFAFASGMFGDGDMSLGFVVSWILRSIIISYEKENNTKLEVKLETENMSREQIREYAIEQMEEILKQIKENPDSFLKKMPNDPTDSFNSDFLK